MTPNAQYEMEIMAASLLALGALHGIFMYRVNGVAARTPTGRMVRSAPNGHPDCVVVVTGKIVYLEFKSADGEQLPDQVTFQAAVEAAGGVYVLARSVREAAGAVLMAATENLPMETLAALATLVRTQVVPEPPEPLFAELAPYTDVFLENKPQTEKKNAR